MTQTIKYASFFLPAFVMLPNCVSTKPPWPKLNCCLIGNRESANDVEANEKFETVSLLQKSVTILGRESDVASQGSHSRHLALQHEELVDRTEPKRVHSRLLQLDDGLNWNMPLCLKPHSEQWHQDIAPYIPEALGTAAFDAAIKWNDWKACRAGSSVAPTTAILRFAWLWSPLLVAAAVCTYMRQRTPLDQAQQFGDTSALTGFRLFLGLWVLLEHAGFHSVAGSGAFVVLSGVVLSVSRRVSPGVSSSPIDSLSSYFRFTFLRLARIIPLYWFYQVALHTNSMSLDRGPADYFAHMPKACMHAWMDAPFKMMLIASVPNLGHAWFVQTVALVYLFYPILERVALGPPNMQPANVWRLYALFGVCCLAKLATGIVMVSYIGHLGYGTWYTWKGWSLYGNPILRLPEFLLGVLVPHLAAPQAKNTFTAWLPVCTDFMLCFMVVMALILPQTKESLLLCNMNVEAPLLVLAMWGLCFGPRHSWLGRLFSMPCLVNAGEWGYGIYLFHPSILGMMRAWGYQFELTGGLGHQYESRWACGQQWFKNHQWDLLTSWSKSVGAAFVIVLLMSWSTFVLIERPVGQCVRWMVKHGKASSSS